MVIVNFLKSLTICTNFHKVVYWALLHSFLGNGIIFILIHKKVYET